MYFICRRGDTVASGKHCEIEFALYKGDEFLDIGTAKYLSNKWGLKQRTIYYLAYSKREQASNKKNGFIALALGPCEEQ